MIRHMFGVVYTQTIVSTRHLWTILYQGIPPAALYLMFYLVGGLELSHHVLMGSLVTQATASGLIFLPQQIVIYRDTRLLAMYVACPIGPVRYLLGFAVGRWLHLTLGTASLVTIMLLLGVLKVNMVPITLMIMACAFMIGSMIGFVLGTHVRDIYTTSALANSLNVAMMMLPPVLYPLSLVPDRWRPIAFLAPTTPVAELLRIVNGMSTASPRTMVLYGLLICGWLSVCLVLVAVKSRWREP